MQQQEHDKVFEKKNRKIKIINFCCIVLYLICIPTMSYEFWEFFSIVALLSFSLLVLCQTSFSKTVFLLFNKLFVLGKFACTPSDLYEVNGYIKLSKKHRALASGYLSFIESFTICSFFNDSEAFQIVLSLLCIVSPFIVFSWIFILVKLVIVCHAIKCC